MKKIRDYGSILLAAVLFEEPFTPASAIGTVLVIGAAIVGELHFSRKKKTLEN